MRLVGLKTEKTKKKPVKKSAKSGKTVEKTENGGEADVNQ